MRTADPNAEEPPQSSQSPSKLSTVSSGSSAKTDDPIGARERAEARRWPPPPGGPLRARPGARAARGVARRAVPRRLCARTFWVTRAQTRARPRAARRRRGRADGPPVRTRVLNETVRLNRERTPFRCERFSRGRILLEDPANHLFGRARRCRRTGAAQLVRPRADVEPRERRAGQGRWMPHVIGRPIAKKRPVPFAVGPRPRSKNPVKKAGQESNEALAGRAELERSPAPPGSRGRRSIAPPAGKKSGHDTECLRARAVRTKNDPE